MLHLRQDNRFNSADNGIGMNYTLTEPNVLPIWEHARQLKGFKVLAYNGDTDPGINSSARPAVAVVAALRTPVPTAALRNLVCSAHLPMAAGYL